MAYQLDPNRSFPDEVRRIAFERLDEAISLLDGLGGSSADDIERAVHDARKRCKETRALARLVRSEIGSEYARCNRTVREAADTLAPIRDAHAVLATLDDLRAVRGVDDVDRLGHVRAGQQAASAEETRNVFGGDPRIERARELLVTARRRVEGWELGDDVTVLRTGLHDTYRRGRSASRRARDRPTDDRVHEWRKTVKHLWYQIRLIERAAPSVLTPLIASLDDLAEALGDDHDLAVLVERLAADPERFGGERSVERVTQLARSEQDELRRRAFRLAATVYAEAPGAFAERMATYWVRTSRLGVELPTGGIAQLVSDERHVTAEDRLDLMVTTERQRKFLVGAVPEFADDGTVLRQGYLAIDGTVSVRVRDAGPHGCTLTLKAGRGAVRTELEVPLDPVEFAATWDHTAGRRIHKSRHHLDVDGRRADVDVFHDDLSGLVLVEVEFDSDEAMAAFRPPAWFGPEVTDDDAYTNAALSLRPPPDLPEVPPANA